MTGEHREWILCLQSRGLDNGGLNFEMMATIFFVDWQVLEMTLVVGNRPKLAAKVATSSASIETRKALPLT